MKEIAWKLKLHVMSAEIVGRSFFLDGILFIVDVRSEGCEFPVSFVVWKRKMSDETRCNEAKIVNLNIKEQYIFNEHKRENVKVMYFRRH